MALSVKDPEADRLARISAELTGETLTETITVALRERVARLRRGHNTEWRKRSLRALSERAANFPILDARSADEILGYDDTGLPT